MQQGYQPPSGGCVLKRSIASQPKSISNPAAFGRLRVETMCDAAGMRHLPQPPSGGCVLKHMIWLCEDVPDNSRLRAAAC